MARQLESIAFQRAWCACLAAHLRTICPHHTKSGRFDVSKAAAEHLTDAERTQLFNAFRAGWRAYARAYWAGVQSKAGR